MGGADLGQEPVNRGRRFEPVVRLRTFQNYLWVERMLRYAPTCIKNHPQAFSVALLDKI